MKKKVFSILLIIILLASTLFVLTACGGSEEEDYLSSAKPQIQTDNPPSKFKNDEEDSKKEVEENKTTSSSEKTKERTAEYDGELTDGAEYVDGVYKYIYNTKELYNEEYTKCNFEEDGWKMELVDFHNTLPIKNELLTSISGKPIVCTAYLFDLAYSKEIDISSFDTSHVYNMDHMFSGCGVVVTGMNALDTSNVQTMEAMFLNAIIKGADFSSFDTSNVQYMGDMFGGAEMDNMDLSSFDTSKVRNFSGIFANMKTDETDISNFTFDSMVTDWNLNGAFGFMTASKIYVKDEATKEFLESLGTGKPETTEYVVR